MRILLVAALLLIGVVGCEDGTLGSVPETRCEKASRLHIEAQCTPSSGREYIIDTACEGANASRCGGGGGDLVASINAISGGAISAVVDLCAFDDAGEPNPGAADCRICIQEHCGQTRAECIEERMGTSYGTLVYECETTS